MIKLEIQKILSFSFTTLLLMFMSIFVNAQNKSIEEKEWQEFNDCGVPVNIVLSSINNKVGDIFLLLDSRYFTEKSLTKLFKCFSKKNSEMASLKITTFSDITNLKLAVRNHLKPLPDENPSDYDSSEEDCKDLAKALKPCPIGYYRAFYNRFKREYFIYSRKPTSRRFLVVNLKN